MASSALIASQPPIPKSNHDDDESEWEYEYSTTETETFYITLDLSKADFTARDPIAASTGPGSYEVGKETEVFLNPHISARNSDGENDDDEYRGGRQQGSQNGKQPPTQDESEPNRGSEDAHRVQILELHAPNPVISYKGRVYTGQWCQNVGTELLLTQRDSSSPSSSLPALRHLEGGSVALLAASSARINVREQELKPRDDGGSSETGNAGEGSRGPTADVVPLPDRGATRERLQQGRFLADLIALKKRRGETDEVTVVAKNVHRRSVRRDEGGEKPGPRRAKGRPRGLPRQQYTPGSTRGRARGVGRGRGRGRGRRGAEGGPNHLRDISLSAGWIDSSTAPSVGGGAVGSAPTPDHWGGLAEEDITTPARDHGMEEDGDEDDEGADEDDDDESISRSSGDEDAGDDEEEAGDMDVDED